MTTEAKAPFRHSRLGRYCPIPPGRPVLVFVLGYPVVFGGLILQTTALLHGVDHALWAGFLTLLFWILANALWVGAFLVGALPLVLVGSLGSLLWATLKARSVKPLQERMKSPGQGQGEGEDLLLCLVQKTAWVLVVVPVVPLLLVLGLSLFLDFKTSFWPVLTTMWLAAGVGGLLLAKRGYLLPLPNDGGSGGGF